MTVLPTVVVRPTVVVSVLPGTAYVPFLLVIVVRLSLVRVVKTVLPVIDAGGIVVAPCGEINEFVETAGVFVGNASVPLTTAGTTAVALVSVEGVLVVAGGLVSIGDVSCVV